MKTGLFILNVVIGSIGGELVDGGEDTVKVYGMIAFTIGSLVTTRPAVENTAFANSMVENALFKDACAAVAAFKDVLIYLIIIRTGADCSMMVTSDGFEPEIRADTEFFITWRSASLMSEMLPATMSSATTMYSVTVFPGSIGGDATEMLSKDRSIEGTKSLKVSGDRAGDLGGLAGRGDFCGGCCGG